MRVSAGVDVEQLLELRLLPVARGGVAEEPAVDLVVERAPAHRVERRRRRCVRARSSVLVAIRWSASWRGAASGNFGSSPNPPCSSSNVAKTRVDQLGVADRSRISAAGGSRPPRWRDSRERPAGVRRRRRRPARAPPAIRSARHERAAPRGSRRRRVRNAVVGQPPRL